MDAILTTILTIVAMIFLGVILKKTGTVNDKIVPSLNSIVLNLFLPSMIFTGLYNANLSNLNQLIVLPFIIILAGLMIVTFFLFCHEEKKAG